MPKIATVICIFGAVLLAATGASPQSNSAGEHSQIIVVFNDGRQQTFSASDLTRIEFKGSSMMVTQDGRTQKFSMPDIARIEFNNPEIGASSVGRGRFLGKWRVGEGDGMGDHFYITLERNGEARKTLGAVHGTWVVVDGEARITWEDGWHDAIRKVGSKFEKVAFEPGHTFSDPPSNVTDAENTSPEPI